VGSASQRTLAEPGPRAGVAGQASGIERMSHTSYDS
jgi:hypothetical protein